MKEQEAELDVFSRHLFSIEIIPVRVDVRLTVCACELGSHPGALGVENASPRVGRLV